MKNLSPRKLKSFTGWMMISMGLAFLIELLNRRSISGLIQFTLQYPVVFFYNACLIALSLTLVFFTKRQKYTFTLVSGIWISLGIINMVIRTFRMTPLTLDDVQFISNITTIMPLYLKPAQIMLVIGASILVIVALVVLFVKTKPQQRLVKMGFVRLGIVLGLVLSIPNISISVARFDETDGNLKTTYDEFGFAYSFVRSVISKGVRKPSGFDEEALLKRLEELKYDSSNAIDANVIVIQLESFFDVTRLSHLNLTSNPIPTFTQLKQQFSSGTLRVPTIGGGTANSEFEFLTSMSLSYFGVGEYPYKTVLRDQSLPSLVSYFNQLDYSTTAIHNHVANFYSRHYVYKNLGFNTFVSLETMRDVTATPMGWAKDIHLIPYIQKAISNSPTKDFVFAVSVQGHGEYPHDPLSGSMIEYVHSSDEKNMNQINYFLNQLHEMDQMVAVLNEWVQSSEEPMMLVLYGDHLPGIDFGLDSETEYLTDYVIVTNFDTKIVKENLELPQLGARALSLIQHSGTMIHQLQQLNTTDKELTHWIHYDWIVGNKVSMDPMFQPMVMRMGLTQPKINSIRFTSEHVILEGTDFLSSYVVMINGKAHNTIVISDTLMMFEGTYEGEYMIEFAIRSDNNELIKIKQ
jgi:phosphoglycerol transferase MdoB-like AlkP superfamily enzyme